MFHGFIRDSSKTGRKLMINAKDLRKAYNDGIEVDVIWTRITYNLADSMKKAPVLSKLVEMIEIGTLNYEIKQSVKINIYKIPETSTFEK